jgi:two-component system cell cycle response regulator CtrA
MRILLVDGDISSARTLSDKLKAGGAAVDVAEAGQETLALARLHDYDIAIIELRLPDMDGYEVIRRLRAAGVETPVIMLSTATQPAARVMAFSVGADDFVARPFDDAELLARLQAVVRRSRGLSKPTLTVGALRLDLGAKAATFGGTAVNLTGKEYAVLELLTVRKGLAQNKEAFIAHLYGGMDEPERKIIDVYICKLRRKLAEAGARNLITTVFGGGYVLRDPPRAEEQPNLSPGMPVAKRQSGASIAA